MALLGNTKRSVLIMISFVFALFFSVESFASESIVLKRDLDCHKCGKHKAPPLTEVNMTLLVEGSGSLNGTLSDYYPSDWVVTDAQGGNISVYNSSYNIIRWSISSIDDYRISYFIRSPGLTAPPTKSYFISSLNAENKSWMVMVSDIYFGEVCGLQPNLPCIYTTDNWNITDDETIFVGGEIYVQSRFVPTLVDMACYDFDGDIQYDACYWNTGGCSGGCNSESCNNFSIPRNMGDDVKYGCNLAGGNDSCITGTHVPSAICPTCNLTRGRNWTASQKGSSGSTVKINVDYYYDCDNSQGARDFEGGEELGYSIVSPVKYDCDDCEGCYTQSNYDFEGDYHNGSNDPSSEGNLSFVWKDIFTDVACTSNKLCSEFFDDELIYSPNGSLNTPCRLKDGENCRLDPDCASNTCKNNICVPNLCNSTISVIVEDSQGYPLDNIAIKQNGVLNGTTDPTGVKEIKVFDRYCSSNFSISAFCPSNLSCGSDTGYISKTGRESIKLDCNECHYNPDLFISENDVRIYLQNGQLRVDATVHSEYHNGTINVLITGFDLNNQDIVRTNNSLDIAPFANYLSTAVWNYSSNIKSVSVYVDSSNVLNESSENNNRISKRSTLLPRVYLDVNTGHSDVDQEIKRFIANYTELVNSENDADVIVVVGGKSLKKGKYYAVNGFMKEKFGYRYDPNRNYVIFDGKPQNKPYNAVVGGFNYSGDNRAYIFVFGSEIDGDLSAVRTLIKDRAKFFNNYGQERHTFIKNNDLEGLSFSDYLRTTRNLPDYNGESEKFSHDVRALLEGKTYTVSLKAVNTTNDGTMLRLTNLNPDYSGNFSNYISRNPVVLQSGIHSDITGLKTLGSELAESGFNVWLTEMVGGPYTDEGCGSKCPNYTFDVLKTYYWPALIAGVQNYSNSTNLSYIGFSLGCTVGLESLENYSVTGKPQAGYYPNGTSIPMSPQVIDTYVAIACPGNFTKLSLLMKAFNISANEELTLFRSRGSLHLKSKDMQKALLSNSKSRNLVHNESPTPNLLLLAVNINQILPFDDHKMSIEIYQIFKEWIDDPTKPEVGKNVSLRNTLVVQSSLNGTTLQGFVFPQDDFDSDGIVPNADMLQTCKNINASVKYYLNFDKTSHVSPSSIVRNSRLGEAIVYFMRYKTLADGGFTSKIISGESDCE